MSMAGRAARVKFGSPTKVVIAKSKTDNLTLNNEAIDITAKDDAGVRVYLNDIGMKSASISCSGLLVDNAQHASLADLATDAGAGTSLHSFDYEVVGFGTWSANWFITSFELGGEDGANGVTFSMSLESSGAITFTPAV